MDCYHTPTTTGSSTTGAIVLPPSAPKDFSILKIGRFNATAQWQAPQLGNPISSYILEVLKNGNWTPAYTGTNLTATILGLAANTSYQFRVAATNKGGKGDYSSAVSAITLPLAAPTKTGNVTLLENSRSSIVVTWARPADDGGATNTFWVIFSVGGTNGTNTTTQVTNNKYGAYGLKINATYSFSVRSCNIMGCSNYTTFASYATLNVACADGFCDTNENCSSCPTDCGPCSYPACPSMCSGHGQCNKGVCDCSVGFTSTDCSIPDSSSLPVKVTVPTSNSTTANDTSVIVPPSVNLAVTKQNGEKVNFGIEFDDIQELDPSDKVVSTMPLNLHNFSLVGQAVVLSDGSTAYQYNYSSVLPNLAIVNITLLTVDSSTFVNFYNHSIKIGENGIKYAMRVTNWPFASIKNTLAIHSLSSSSSSSSATPCQDTFTNDNANLQWLKVFINGVTLYGSFQNYAMLDDVMRNISFSFDSAASVVTVKVPFFWQTAEFDPNFQVLLDTQTTSEVICQSNNKKSNNISGKIAGAVVGSVVGAALLIGVGIFVYLSLKKRQTMKRLNSS